MKLLKRYLSSLWFVLPVSLCVGFTSLRADATRAAEPPASPETRALAFLAKETPAWMPENKCFSCHNNGVAVRALYTAGRLGQSVSAKSLADTTEFLGQPQRWDKNGPDGPFNDRKLARVQFAAALLDGLDAKHIKGGDALARAAEQLAEDQTKDGSWSIGADGTPGSPTTLGRSLATLIARNVLQRADAERYGRAIAKADEWFLKLRVTNVLDAGAVLLALPSKGDKAVEEQRQRCLDLIRRGQSKNGGWGPYVDSPPEVFDTAVVVLALVQHKDESGTADLLKKGRAYLVATQKKDGSWQETTRPTGAESYAQRISTTGWATLALLATEK